MRLILWNWLADRYGEDIRERLYATATEAMREAAAGAAEAASEDSAPGAANAKNGVSPDSPSSDGGTVASKKNVDVGFVFALGQEYGCLLDLFKGVKTTKGGGVKYHEARFQGRNVVLAESGIGEEKARAATLALIQAFHPQRIISAGFSGGLVSSLSRRQIVIPREIIRRSTGEKIDLWRQFLPPEAEKKDASPSSRSDLPAGRSDDADSRPNGPPPSRDDDPKPDDPFDLRFAVGTLLTSDEIVSQPSEKKRLGEKFGASLVDMETFAVADTCRSANVPFLAVRVILDPLDETLPPDLKNLTDSAGCGTARVLGALFGTVTRRPSSLLDIYQLKENALTAADALADALAEILATTPGPGVPSSGSDSHADGRK